MRFGLIAYPKKALIIAHSGMSRETRFLKIVQSLLQHAFFVFARSESPGEVMRTCRLVEHLAHAGVIRTIIPSAAQFFIADHYFVFLFSIII